MSELGKYKDICVDWYCSYIPSPCKDTAMIQLCLSDSNAGLYWTEKKTNALMTSSYKQWPIYHGVFLMVQALLQCILELVLLPQLLKTPPQYLESLFDDVTEQDRKFRDKIQRYNAAFASIHPLKKTDVFLPVGVCGASLCWIITLESRHLYLKELVSRTYKPIQMPVVHVLRNFLFTLLITALICNLPCLHLTSSQTFPRKRCSG
ncbi:hypothetical protein BDB01DRAFT_833003 [Pilobolus umbonatus]|nr:hypothetical protein BDB01DRAFT_833003 [Pilobolus umbonatus]